MMYILLAALGFCLAYFIVNNMMEARVYLSLPGGYVLWKTENGAIIRYNPKTIANYEQGWPDTVSIGPKVDGYHVYSSIITGKVTLYSPDIEFGAALVKQAIGKGYFIIDLHTKKVYGGLSKSNWMSKLRLYSIHKEPELYASSWRDGRLGRTRPQADDLK